MYLRSCILFSQKSFHEINAFIMDCVTFGFKSLQMASDGFGWLQAAPGDLEDLQMDGFGFGSVRVWSDSFSIPLKFGSDSGRI